MKTAPSAAMVLLLVGAMYTQPIRVEVQPGAEFRFRSARERPHLRNRRKRDGASVRDLTAEDGKSGTKKEELCERCRWITNSAEWHDCFASLR